MGKSKIVYGSRIFESGDIKSGNCYLAVSLLSDSLEMNTLDFEVESDDTSLTNFVRNTPLTYYNDGEQVGIFFVQKVKRTAKTRYSFACTSAMGLLDETDHYGGIYTGETVAEVVKSICGNCVAYRVKTNLKKIALYGYLPKATCRANLSQVLFAIGAAVKSDLDGYLRIEGLWDEASGAIDEDHVYAGGSVEGDTPVTRVVVTEHQYIKGSETKTLFEGTTADGDIIVFDEPMHDLTADGFTILESGVNFAKVSTGNGTLTGTAYIHSTREVSKEVTAAEAENVVRVEDATLVSLANANAVAERLAAYYAARESVEQDVVYDGELPGDVVDMAHPYGGTVQSCIESTDITLSGRLRSTERHLVGYRPPDIGNEEYYDHAELITEDGEWVVPEGVTNVRVVLIGGGCGGCGGLRGGDSQENAQTFVKTNLTTEYFSGYPLALGGTGGRGGRGGEGGKILQASMDVSTGMVFAAKIGRGGTGGEHAAEDEEVAGSQGSDTIFGKLSSGNGANNANGFTDVLSGTVYGGTGDEGIAGGDGIGRGGEISDTFNVKEVQPIVDEDGEIWSPGVTEMHSTAKRVHVDNKRYDLIGSLVAGTSTNCGSGAAAGANGVANGGSGSISVGGAGTTSLWARAYGCSGTKGADAVKIPHKQTKPGFGGRGGYGGGGGGSPGFALTGKIYGKGASFSASETSGNPGVGGFGSNGGAGGDGCVLVYYRIPKQVSAGRFRTRDGRDFADNHKRQVVV